MKKFLFSFLALTFLTSLSYGACPVSTDCNKASDCGCNKSVQQCEKSYNNCAKDCEKPEYRAKDCENKCLNGCDNIDDDEYCTFNQCYFDKKFKKMKTTLCLSKKQECQIDAIYKQFKSDMEILHSKYRVEKTKLLEMLACDNDCYKDQVKVLKDIKKSAKQKCKDFKDEVKEQLCKDQYGAYRKYQRQEKRKFKKIIKYGAIYKLPCTDCCGK